MPPHGDQFLGAGLAGVGQAGLERAPQRALGGGHGGGRVLRDLQRQRLRLVAEIPGRVDDLAHHPERERPLRADALVAPDQRHAHDGLKGDLAGERDRLVGRDLTHRDVGVEELRVRRSQHDVGVGDEVEAAPGTDAVDGGDDRLPNAVVPGRHAQLGALGPSRLLAQRGGVARQLHDVEAGLERAAGPGVNDDADLGVGVELLPRRLELVEHARVHGVARVGPVEHQPAHRPAALDEQR